MPRGHCARRTELPETVGVWLLLLLWLCLLSFTSHSSATKVTAYPAQKQQQQQCYYYFEESICEHVSCESDKFRVDTHLASCVIHRSLDCPTDIGEGEHQQPRVITYYVVLHRKVSIASCYALFQR